MMTIPAKVAANRRSKLVRQLRMPLFWHRYVQYDPSIAVLAVLSVLSVLSVPSVLPVVLFGSDPPSIIRLKYHSIASFSSIPFFQCFQLIAVPFPTRSYGVLLRRLA